MILLRKDFKLWGCQIDTPLFCCNRLRNKSGDGGKWGMEG